MRCAFMSSLLTYVRPMLADFRQPSFWYGPDFVEQSATDSVLRDAMDGKGSTFRFRPCGQERWKRGMRRGRSTTGRPPRHRVAGENERKTQVYGVRVCPAEARFTFLPPSPQSPPSSSPSKTSWATALLQRKGWTLRGSACVVNLTEHNLASLRRRGFPMGTGEKRLVSYQRFSKWLQAEITG
jgi:hypothetical protein